MSSLLMAGGRLLIPVDFNEHKSSWIVILLNEVEAGDTLFLKTAARIIDGCPDKSIQIFWFYVDKHMHNQHNGSLLCGRNIVESRNLS